MFKIFFFSALRGFVKNKTVSSINILGLTIGLTAFFFFVKYLVYERSYDSFFNNSDRIYRVNLSVRQEGESVYEGAKTPRQLYFQLKENNPWLEANGIAYYESCLVKNNDNQFPDQEVLWVDEGFEKVFPLKMLRGKADYTRPLTGIISQSKAESLFGNAEPVGKILYVNEGMTIEITGIFEDLYSNTHLEADYFMSMKTWVHYGYIGATDGWRYNGWWNYIKLKPGITASHATQAINEYVKQYMGFLNDQGRTAGFFLQPLPDLHFVSDLKGEMGANTSKKSLFNLLLIAILTIVIAYINYINLSTAQSIKRRHEIGMRKLIGATRKHLFIQSFFESAFLSILSVGFSLVLYKILSPPFENYFEVPFETAFIPNKYVILSVLTALLAGMIFSTLFNISGLTGIKMFSAVTKKKSTGGYKKGMLILQMTISIIFISSTLIVFKQILFMKNYNLGFETGRVITFSAPASLNTDNAKREKYSSFKTHLLENPEFESATWNAFTMGQEPRYGINFEFERREAGIRPKDKYFFNNTDEGFLETFGIQLLAGKNFDTRRENNEGKILITKKGSELLGFSSPEQAVGNIIQVANNPNRQLEIMGVIANFHNEGLQKEMYPVVFDNNHPAEFGFYSVKMNTANIASAIEKLKSVWSQHYPNDPLNYFFADKYFNKQYQAHERFGKFYAILAILAISISVLGLYGLLLFYLLQHRKELSIRKVNGAQTAELLYFVNKNFITLQVIAFIISCPLVFYLMNTWLSNFAYRISVKWWALLLSGLLTLAITVATVCWQSIKVARQNPADALHYE